MNSPLAYRDLWNSPTGAGIISAAFFASILVVVYCAFSAGVAFNADQQSQRERCVTQLAMFDRLERSARDLSTDELRRTLAVEHAILPMVCTPGQIAAAQPTTTSVAIREMSLRADVIEEALSTLYIRGHAPFVFSETSTTATQRHALPDAEHKAQP